MKFAGKAWKLLVGIKDGLVLLFMLIFFGGLYAALSASPYKDSAARGALRLDLAGAIVEQPAVRSPFDAGRRQPGHPPISGQRARPRARRGRDRRPHPGGRARPRHLHRRRPDRDRRRRRGARPVPARQQARRRLRHRLWRRRLPARRPCRRDLARPAGRGADRRAGRHQPLLCRPARAARRHRQRLPRRRVQVGGRALHPQRHVARGARGRARRSPTRSGGPGSRTSARRGRGRRSPPMSPTPPASSPRPAATWRRRRCSAGLVDQIGDRTAVRPAHGRARRHRRRATCPAATARSITTPGSTTIRRADSGGQIARAHRRRRHRRRQRRRPGTAGGETIAAQPRARASSAATSRRWSSGSICRAAR